MIAKIVKGSSFYGAINYMIDKEKNAEIIASEGIRLKDNHSIIDSFQTQQAMNSKIKNPVYHISLDFSVQDKEKLSNERMVEIAKDYMDKMNIKNTQYVIVRHYDKEHPHIHLCINRIDNKGGLISDKHDRYRSEKICKDLTRQYRLYFAKGKERVKTHRLKEPDRTRYQIYDAVKKIIPKSTDWSDFKSELAKQDIDLSFKYKSGSNEIQGIIFSKNGFSFSGSKIDRNLSYSKLNLQFAEIAYYASLNQETDTAQKTIMHSVKDASLGAFNVLEASGNTDDDKKRKRGRKI